MIARLARYLGLLAVATCSLGPSVAAAQPSGPEPYGIFLAGNDVLVGQESALKRIPTCLPFGKIPGRDGMSGWGTDCAKTVGQVATLTRVQGVPPASTFDAARAAYCGSIEPGTERAAGRLVGGRDREVRFKFDGQYHLTRNAPACLAQPAAPAAVTFTSTPFRCTPPAALSPRQVEDFLNYIGAVLWLAAEKAENAPSPFRAIGQGRAPALPRHLFYPLEEAAADANMAWKLVHGLRRAAIDQRVTLTADQIQRTAAYGHWADWIESRARGSYKARPAYPFLGPIAERVPTPPQLVAERPGPFLRWFETYVWDFGVKSTVEILSMTKWYTAVALATYHAYNQPPTPNLPPGQVDVQRFAPVFFTSAAYVPVVGPTIVGGVTLWTEANAWYQAYETGKDPLSWDQHLANWATGANLALGAKLTYDLKTLQAKASLPLDEGAAPREVARDPAFNGKSYRELPRTDVEGKPAPARVKHPPADGELVEVEYAIVGKYEGKTDPNAFVEKQRAVMVRRVDAQGRARYFRPRLEEFSPAEIGKDDLLYGGQGAGGPQNPLRALQRETGRGRLLEDVEPPYRLPRRPSELDIINQSVAVMDAEVGKSQKGNKIVFDLTLLEDLPGVLGGVGKHADRITSHELRHILRNWGRGYDGKNVVFIRKVGSTWRRESPVWSGEGDPFFSVGEEGYHIWKHLTELNAGHKTPFASLQDVLGGLPEYAGEMAAIQRMLRMEEAGGLEAARQRYVGLTNALMRDARFPSLASGYYRYLTPQGAASAPEANYFIQVPRSCGGQRVPYPVRVSIDPQNGQLKNLFVLDPLKPGESFRPAANLQNQLVDWNSLHPVFYQFAPVRPYVCDTCRQN